MAESDEGLGTNDEDRVDWKKRAMEKAEVTGGGDVKG